MKATAPIVTLFYRKGWYLTPDDPVSPFGKGEAKMTRMYEKYGKFIADWWWLGIRNPAFGLAYKLKPQIFKDMTTYKNLKHPELEVKQGRFLRTITILGYKEYFISLKYFHILVGYRLRPIVSSLYDHAPYRAINMDARPIFSIRAGGEDN